MWSKLMVVAVAAISSLTLPDTVSRHQPTENDNVIYWSPRTKLIGTDFKKPPVEDSHFSAGSHLGTGLEISYSESHLKFTVKAYFVPEKSWIKVHDEDLLTHEQAHFDIEEYYARLVRKELQQIRIKGRSFEDIRKESDLVFARLLAERERFQAQFDEETGHSVNVEKEKEWEAKIKQGLIETRDYASPDILFSM